MQVHIQDLEFKTIIGILDFERTTPQKITVDLNITYQYTNNDFINYAEVSTHIEQQMQLQEFELIEDALLSLQKSLKKSFPLIEKLYLKISKPDIMSNCTVALSETFNF